MQVFFMLTTSQSLPIKGKPNQVQIVSQNSVKKNCFYTEVLFEIYPRKLREIKMTDVFRMILTSAKSFTFDVNNDFVHCKQLQCSVIRIVYS